jgi:ubiquinone/menaquinone biosynthesis C-methylase UbiE
MLGPPLSADEAEIFETVIVPRYLTFFAGPAVEMSLPSSGARVAHLGCRTGFPDEQLVDRFRDGEIVGVDPSADAIELARMKASLLSNARVGYVAHAGLPTPLPAESFSHALSLHPLGGPAERATLMAEMRRILIPGGQALLALPLRGSFPEISDMLREFSLRQDLADLGTAVDHAWSSRASVETIADELERAGLVDVDVDVQLLAVSFQGGREFLDDPITRMMVLPDVRAGLNAEASVVDAAARYLHDAIARYWSEGVFELTVNVGCASARRP